MVTRHKACVSAPPPPTCCECVLGQHATQHKALQVQQGLEPGVAHVLVDDSREGTLQHSQDNQRGGSRVAAVWS